MDSAMSKIKSPLRFSKHFGIAPANLKKLGAFDTVLQADTKLFIDPTLIKHSKIPEMSGAATKRIYNFFSELYTLIKASKLPNDVAWKAAKKKLKFHEQIGTCLGYGGGSIDGSGWGAKLTEELLIRANEIIKLGVDDPNLFLLIGLFSENIGPDRLSDMVTNIALEDLANYTTRICTTLAIPTREFKINNRSYDLPVNPSYTAAFTPVILVPRDVLKDLPVALNASRVWEVASQNDAIRDRMNKEVGSMWTKISKETKSEFLGQILKDPNYAKHLIKQLIDTATDPYDQDKDPRGYLIWTELAYVFASIEPRIIKQPKVKNIETLNVVVEDIIDQFKYLLEKRDQWKLLHESDSRKIEKTAQMLFFAVAFSYCQANNLDITPEADTGNGTVDFKFADGLKDRILVELKLSKNNVQHGHDEQLPAYVEAENAKKSHYVVIDLGDIGNKWNKLIQSRNESTSKVTKVWLVDASPKLSASAKKTIK